MIRIRYGTKTVYVGHKPDDMVKNKNITTSQLALMTAAAVISLRGLPLMAQADRALVF